MRCANFSRVKITQAKAVHGVCFKAEISLGKQIRSPAKRSMNIHEKNAVCSRALCVRPDPGILQFIFFGMEGTGTACQVSALMLYSKSAKPQTFAHSRAGPSGTAHCQVQTHSPGQDRGCRRPVHSLNRTLQKLRCSEVARGLVGRQFSHVRGWLFHQLRGASGGTLSWESRIPWPPQAKIQESHGWRKPIC